MSPSNPQDTLAIRNTLSRYCEALDTKIFPLLSKVFVPDVIADYPFNPDLKGVDAISAAIQNRLGPVPTHHSLTTQLITFDKNGKSAHASTHFIGAHFGKGPHEGKVLTAYGTYIDELVCLAGEEDGEGNEGDYDGVPGASGVWRIRKRTVGFTARIGDERIMKEY